MQAGHRSSRAFRLHSGIVLEMTHYTGTGAENEKFVPVGGHRSARVVPNVMANSILPAASVSCLFVAVKLGMLHLRVCSGVGEKLDK
jgi:hypothetical protein